jgi:hypothetical protein
MTEARKVVEDVRDKLADLVAIANDFATALDRLYAVACHHSHCVRGRVPHTCSCGVSAALQAARVALRKDVAR